MQHYDVIFAGAGVAGLSLAYHLLSGPLAGARALLVDRNFSQRNDHALSFWTTGPTPFEPLVARTWRRLLVAGPGFVRETPLQRYRYQTIRARDFQRFMLDSLDAMPGVTRLEASISRVQDGDDSATVWVGGQPYRAAWVFDSRLDREALQPRGAGADHDCLWQYFQGWEIETPADHFDAQTATLMDLRLPRRQDLPPRPLQEGPWRFFYVLPYTARRALVELVTLQPEHDSRTLADYVSGVLGVAHYQIARRESGAIPLSDGPFPRRLGCRVMAIGTRGGRIKPSTGYGFMRMQQDAIAITRSMQRRGHPFDVPGDRPFFHFCDRLMLLMLSRHSEWALPMFSALLQHNPLERVLGFLDEQTSPLQNARLSYPLFSRLLALADPRRTAAAPRVQRARAIRRSL